MHFSFTPEWMRVCRLLARMSATMSGFLFENCGFFFGVCLNSHTPSMFNYSIPFRFLFVFIQLFIAWKIIYFAESFLCTYQWGGVVLKTAIRWGSMQVIRSMFTWNVSKKNFFFFDGKLHSPSFSSLASFHFLSDSKQKKN